MSVFTYKKVLKPQDKLSLNTFKIAFRNHLQTECALTRDDAGIVKVRVQGGDGRKVMMSVRSDFFRKRIVEITMFDSMFPKQRPAPNAVQTVIDHLADFNNEPLSERRVGLVETATAGNPYMPSEESTEAKPKWPWG